MFLIKGLGFVFMPNANLVTYFKNLDKTFIIVYLCILHLFILPSYQKWLMSYVSKYFLPYIETDTD